MPSGWALLALATIQSPDGAAAWIEPLGAGVAEDDVFARRCTGDGRSCARLEEDPATNVRTLRILAEGAEAARYVPPGQDGDVQVALWPHVIREAGGAAIFGLERHRMTGFSGGGAQSITVELVRVADGAATPVLEFPLSAMLEIRACFSEAARRARRDACSDSYEFGGRLSLGATPEGGPPELVLETRARTYPGRRSRGEDNSGLTLRRADLVWAADPVCSYRRTFRFDAAAGRYVPDAPLPDCADYFDF